MTRQPKPKNLIHEIFPAEKRLARIDSLDIDLERKWRDKEIPLTEYVRAKQALTFKRLQEFRRIERANGWNPGEVEDPPPSDAPAEDIEELAEPPPDPETPLPRRLLHYAIFWGWLVFLSWLICMIAPILKKL